LFGGAEKLNIMIPLAGLQ